MTIARSTAFGELLRTWIASLLLGMCGQANAIDSIDWQGKLAVDYWGGVRLDDGDRALSRLTLQPSARVRAAGWQADLALRVEVADDITGLGTVTTFAAPSRPLIERQRLRLEIDQANWMWRSGALRMQAGKQTIAWGVLDGLQVTDRFTPVRRRDFLLTETRPERLSRWGSTARLGLDNGWLEFALALDASVSQQASPGTAFAPRARRYRGGLPLLAVEPPVQVSNRNRYLRDSTIGLRLGRRLEAGELTLLALSGPETDPLIRLEQSVNAPSIMLDYPRRTLLGGTLERSAGARVWRGELAFIPDQTINVDGAGVPATDRRARLLGGIGMDWKAAGGWFFNAQLGLDHLAGGAAAPVQPRSEAFGTLRVQRSLRNDSVVLRTEYLGSLRNGDGTWRSEIEWRARDRVTISSGMDLLFGQSEGVFGQFRREDRVWLRVRYTFG